MSRNRWWLLALLTSLVMSAMAIMPSPAQAQNASLLRPPKGAKLALIVFEDLQCPDCANANSLLVEAARTYGIPLVRHDFPLPQHAWAFEAAVYARYFDTKASQLGDRYRDYMFAHQAQTTKENLRQVTEAFAQQHHILPFTLDPQGRLAELVKADVALGERVGVTHTPTIYVVSNARQGKPFVEVVERKRLFELIDSMRAQAQ